MGGRAGRRRGRDIFRGMGSCASTSVHHLKNAFHHQHPRNRSGNSFHGRGPFGGPLQRPGRGRDGLQEFPVTPVDQRGNARTRVPPRALSSYDAAARAHRRQQRRAANLHVQFQETVKIWMYNEDDPVTTPGDLGVESGGGGPPSTVPSGGIPQPPGVPMPATETAVESPPAPATSDSASGPFPANAGDRPPGLDSLSGDGSSSQLGSGRRRHSNVMVQESTLHRQGSGRIWTEVEKCRGQPRAAIHLQGEPSDALLCALSPRQAQAARRASVEVGGVLMIEHSSKRTGSETSSPTHSSQGGTGEATSKVRPPTPPPPKRHERRELEGQASSSEHAPPPPPLSQEQVAQQQYASSMSPQQQRYLQQQQYRQRQELFLQQKQQQQQQQQQWQKQSQQQQQQQDAAFRGGGDNSPIRPGTGSLYQRSSPAGGGGGASATMGAYRALNSVDFGDPSGRAGPRSTPFGGNGGFMGAVDSPVLEQESGLEWPRSQRTHPHTESGNPGVGWFPTSSSTTASPSKNEAVRGVAQGTWVGGPLEEAHATHQPSYSSNAPHHSPLFHNRQSDVMAAAAARENSLRSQRASLYSSQRSGV